MSYSYIVMSYPYIVKSYPLYSQVLSLYSHVFFNAHVFYGCFSLYVFEVSSVQIRQDVARLLSHGLCFATKICAHDLPSHGSKINLIVSSYGG